MLSLTIKRKFTTISPPPNKFKPNNSSLKIGDHYSLARSFSQPDVDKFAYACQDLHASHLNPENASTFCKPNIIYGAFSSSTFSMIFRDLFPGCILLGMNCQFRSPVFVDEMTKAEIMVTEIKKDWYTFDLKMVNVDTGKEAIRGEATLKLPNVI